MTSHDMRAYGLGTPQPAAPDPLRVHKEGGSDKLSNPLPRIREKGGLLFLALRPNDRVSVATTIEALINLADACEPDPDLEPFMGGYPGSGDDRESADDERLFGSGFGTAGCEDDEDADPAGGDVVDEPHDAEPDLEWSLGWTEMLNQASPHRFMQVDLGDGEEDGGDMLEGGDEREDNPHRDAGFGWADDTPNIPQDGPHFWGACGREPSPVPGGAW